MDVSQLLIIQFLNFLRKLNSKENHLQVKERKKDNFE